MTSVLWDPQTQLCSLKSASTQSAKMDNVPRKPLQCSNIPLPPPATTSSHSSPASTHSIPESENIKEPLFLATNSDDEIDELEVEQTMFTPIDGMLHFGLGSGVANKASLPTWTPLETSATKDGGSLDSRSKSPASHSVSKDGDSNAHVKLTPKPDSSLQLPSPAPSDVIHEAPTQLATTISDKSPRPATPLHSSQLTPPSTPTQRLPFPEVPNPSSGISSQSRPATEWTIGSRKPSSQAPIRWSLLTVTNARNQGVALADKEVVALNMRHFLERVAGGDGMASTDGKRTWQDEPVIPMKQQVPATIGFSAFLATANKSTSAMATQSATSSRIMTTTPKRSRVSSYTGSSAPCPPPQKKLRFDNDISEAKAREWRTSLQRLAKGKCRLDRQELKGLSGIMQQITEAAEKIPLAIVKDTKLGQCMRLVSELSSEDVPFEDDDLIQRAQRVVDIWARRRMIESRLADVTSC